MTSTLFQLLRFLLDGRVARPNAGTLHGLPWACSSHSASLWAAPTSRFFIDKCPTKFRVPYEP